MARIDLNSDLGESFGPWPMGDDAAMLAIVSSANIACGFHAGDPAGILRVLREAELAIDLKPEFLMIGASGLWTLSTPAAVRDLTLPTLQRVTRMARQAGVPTMLHCCGNERALAEILANETELDCVNPLEAPPQGDCDLGEVKRSLGHRLALFGNLPTTSVMLFGTPDEVEQAARKAIDDAAAGGGFILSTGDQCGRDTPDANLFKLVEVAKSYGRY